MSKNSFSEDFIANLNGGEERLQSLYKLLDKAEEVPVLINVYVVATAQNDEEQADLGGYGKSLIIYESSNYIEQKRTSSGDAGSQLQKDPVSKIDLAVRYTTKKDILWQIGEKLGFPEKMSDWVKPKKDLKEMMPEEQKKYEDLYWEIFVDKNSDNKHDYDPSYIAEKLFVKVASCNPQGKRWKSNILFFDSFDFQYLGDDHSPLRLWLRDKLFPYLVLKLGVSVFVSGRERLEHEQREHKNELPIQEFQLQTFNTSQCKDYFLKYGKRKKSHESYKAEGYKKSSGLAGDIKEIETEMSFMLKEVLPKWETLTAKVSENEWKKIDNLTGGKPIILDFFADLCFRECIVKPLTNGNALKPIGEILKAASNEGMGDTPQEKFKMYLINRIHNHSFNRRDIDKFGFDMADALVFLSIAKHGMEVYDFLMVRDRKLNPDEISDKEKKRVEDFFNYTLNERYLSFVKNVKDAAKNSKEQDRRLLHDEVILLFKRYNLDLFDKNYEKRNTHLRHITALYKKQMDEIGRRHDRYPRLLLEYMEYRFDYRGLDEERATINFFLYEFSYYLNRYADLNSRFIQIARKYYRNKEKQYNEKRENLQADTVLFSKHFNLLSKILLRENHYHLTTRSEGWASKVFSDRISLINDRISTQQVSKKEKNGLLPIIDDVYNPQNLSLLEQRDKIGLRARALSATGEAKIWLTRWEESREELELSKQLFYRTGESHGLAWVEHLLGFEAQRESRFELAEKHHRDALETAFLFSQRLILEAKNEKETQPDDWHHRYRLRYLVELSNRANGNLALRLRYQGRLLDALKILNANRSLAEISGIREEVRNNSNAIQYETIVGRDSDFNAKMGKIHDKLPGLDDLLLKRRASNTELVHLIKSIGLESRVYRKRAQSYFFLKPHNQNKVEKKRKEISLVCGNLANALAIELNPLTIVSQESRNSLFTFLPLSDIANPLSGKNLTREVADMYYQLGKLIISIQEYPDLFLSLSYYKNELQNFRRRNHEKYFFFEVARVAFHNAYLAAQKSTFLYLQMEAAESLYRLSYLSFPHNNRQLEYRGMYLAAQEIMVSDIDGYGTFHDLLSKFHITEADLMLDNLLEKHHLIPSMFITPLETMANALWHGYQHNQERYMLILNVFTNRMKNILTKLHIVGLEDEFAEYFLEDIISKSKIYHADPNFHIYLSHFLRALKMELNNVIDWNVYRKVKLGISGLMEYGKFVKAADVNTSLIRLLNKSLTAENSAEMIQKIKRQLALRYYQQVYCFIGANRWKRANDLFENASVVFSGNDQFIFDSSQINPSNNWYRFNTLEAAIMGLAKGIATYRTNEYWNIETFILGEEADFRKDKEHMHQLLEAERYLLGVAFKLNKTIISFESAQKNPEKNFVHDIHPEEKTVIIRLVSEAFFRLGELYILLNPSMKDKTISRVANLVKQDVVPLLDGMMQERGADANGISLRFKKTHRGGRSYDDSMAILMLSCAYYAAILANDKHRAADSLQSIANARYMRGETRANGRSNQDAIENIINNLNKGVLRHTRRNDLQSKKQIIYPVTEAKHWLVEGDVFFSELFEFVPAIKSKTNPTPAYFRFREESFDQNDRRRNSKIKGLLHEMMWRYLFALDLLTDEKNKYDSYHFQNMAYEINRRIMHIKDPQLVRYVMEDLRSVWNLFPNLRSKERILQSLEHDLRTHALALSIKEILDEA